MALTATEEAQVKALIAQNAALLSLASSEPTIISKLAATKVSLADLTAASTVADSDLFLVRQGSTEKSITKSVLAPIATNAEAQAFTAEKLIDGAKLAAALKGANQSLAASGYQKLPGGLIIQWGLALSVPSGNVPLLLTLPIAFPTGFLQAAAAGNGAMTVDATFGISPSGLSKINIYNSSATSQTVRFIVLGY